MKPEIAQRWAKALRSGRYQQGKKVLYNGTHYDALGVLVQLYLDEKKLTWNKTTEKTRVDYDPVLGHIYVDAFVFRGETSCLPTCVLKWAGMCEGDGSFMEEYEPGKWTRADKPAVSELNDKGLSFYAIAKEIQNNYEYL